MRTKPFADLMTTALLGMALPFLFSVGCSLFVDLDQLSPPHGRAADASVDSIDAAADGMRDRSPDAAVGGSTPDATAAESDGGSVGPRDANDGDGDADAADGDSVGDDATSAVDSGVPDIAPEEDGGSPPPPDASVERVPMPPPDAQPDVLPPLCPLFSAVGANLSSASSAPQTTACGYSGDELPRFYVAVDAQTFAASTACGTCIEIQTAAATVVALVVDQGPGRSSANPTAIAVSRPALAMLLPDGSTFSSQGVEWRFTPCPLATPGMTFTLQAGSNASYAAVLVQNYRHRLDKVEYKLGNSYQALTRASYNYWIASQGMGSGPFTLRMTDQLGNTVEQAGIPLAPGKVFTGQSQFPPCRAN